MQLTPPSRKTFPQAATMTRLSETHRLCGGTIRLRVDVSRCAIRTRGAAHGPSPGFPGMGSARGSSRQAPCRREHAARLRSHRWPGHDGTSTCETRCGSEGASGAARAVCGVLEPAASQNFVSSALAAWSASWNVVALRWCAAKAR